jgi:peptide/nickel transport system permease protein
VTGAVRAAAVAPTARRGARYALRHPGVALSLLVLLTVLGWTLAPGWFTAESPTEGTVAHRFLAPSRRHPFGTDHLGRDLYARVVYGASMSLRVSVAAIALAVAAGALLGLLSGFFGGWLDVAVTRAVDVMLAFPPVLLSLLVISALGHGTVDVAIAVGSTSVAGFTRVMRASVLRACTAAYVEAAGVCGIRWWRLLPRHVLPPALRPVLALAALDFGLVLLAVSALSFLGYGQPPPAPEWGALVAGGRDYLARAWWLSTLPGLTVAVVVLAANRLSRMAEQPGGRP